MTTFKDVSNRYETSFLLTEDEATAIKAGVQVYKRFNSGMGSFPYVINGIDHELNYDRAENGAHAYELNVTPISGNKSEKAFGYSWV